MLFNTETYVFFLGAVVLVNWLLPPRIRVVFLLLASYFFYAFWSVPFLSLIFGLTVANYVFGRLQGGRRSKWLLAAIVALDLSALGVFKYLGLLESSAIRIATFLGVGSAPPIVHIILPLGLSFFTFEFLHYQVDIYRGGEPVRDPIQFALFPAFFPTQVAGPIKRYQDFVGQLSARPRWDPEQFLEGIELVALGMFKKVVLADSLLPVADAVFAHPVGASGLEVWTGLVAFSFQIYLDFSGYTDVARGSAQLLGYRVPLNFRAPYLASSIRDFWHRWHMSLSSWLRDYLYIPLGGSRKGELRTLINLLLTMSLGGLWHGAAWHFVAWGAGHGAGLAAHRAYRDFADRQVRRPALPTVAGWAGTQIFVLILWTLFRAPGAAVALQMLRGLASGGMTAGLLGDQAVLKVFAVVGSVLLVELVNQKLNVAEWLRSQAPGVLLRPAAVVALGSITVYIAALQVVHRFIYFQF